MSNDQSSSNAGGVRVDALVEHFPTGVRGLYDRTAGGVPVQSHVGTNCACGWCTAATDEHEVRHQWAEHVLASLSTPTAEPTDLFAENAKKSGAETLDGLEWTEDGYSLRTPYDGDADGDGRPIIVGGEIVVTFSDSDEGDKYRERILRALTTPPTPDRIGKDAVREAVNRILGELLGALMPDVQERIAVGNRACDEILAALSATPAQEGEA